MFRSRASPFDIPEFRTPGIEKTVKIALTSTTTPDIPLAQVQAVVNEGFSLQGCTMVIAHLLHFIDKCGSHALQVYKALSCLIACLTGSHSRLFLEAARLFVPEIGTILLLSFGAADAPSRDHGRRDLQAVGVRRCPSRCRDVRPAQSWSQTESCSTQRR
jgi:hypothetical protein